MSSCKHGITNEVGIRRQCHECGADLGYIPEITDLVSRVLRLEEAMGAITMTVQRARDLDSPDVRETYDELGRLTGIDPEEPGAVLAMCKRAVELLRKQETP